MDKLITVTEADMKRFYELNQKKKRIEQELNQLKKSFHEHIDESFGKERKGEIVRGKYKVERHIRLAVNYHPEKTVERLEELNLCDFIETMKRPHIEKIEAALKLGLIDQKDIEDCKHERITQAIVVKET